MESELEEAINEWHEAVTSGDLPRSAAAVGEPIVVLSQKGGGTDLARAIRWLGGAVWHSVGATLVASDQRAADGSRGGRDVA